jgi:hypothetical protein
VLIRVDGISCCGLGVSRSTKSVSEVCPKKNVLLWASKIWERKNHLIIIILPFLFVGKCSTGGNKLDYLFGPIVLVR